MNKRLTDSVTRVPFNVNKPQAFHLIFVYKVLMKPTSRKICMSYIVYVSFIHSVVVIFRYAYLCLTYRPNLLFCPSKNPNNLFLLLYSCDIFLIDFSLLIEFFLFIQLCLFNGERFQNLQRSGNIRMLKIIV